MSGAIARGAQIYALTISDSAAITSAVDMTEFSGGYVNIPTSWTAANMGFKVCHEAGGTYVILRDEAGNPVQISGIITDAAAAYPLPSALFACRWIKLWSKSSTAATVTDTNQSGDITVTLVLKS